jgi:hypothetical protein
MCCALLVNADLRGVQCPVPGHFCELSIAEIMQMMQENDVMNRMNRVFGAS